MYCEIRLSGLGGQGLGFGGKVLAEAAGIGAGYSVTMTQHYDFRARGGESTADLVISSDEIFVPTLSRIDYLIAMGGKALEISLNLLQPGGIVIVDSDIAGGKAQEKLDQIGQRVISYPFTRIAKEKVGSELSATIVGLGVLGQVSNLFEQNILRSAIEKGSPKAAVEKNLRALQIGYELNLAEQKAGLASIGVEPR